MEVLLKAVKDGFIKALKTGTMLLKVVLPVYFVVVLIKYSPVMPWLNEVCKPAMTLFNLPAEAVVPIVTGLLSDEYGVATALQNFNFTTAQITTVAMIALVAHSLPVEAAVTHKIGMPAIKFTLFRIVFAVLTGILVGWIGGIVL